MPIAIDATTPAVVTGAASATTASFTAPGDSFLVGLWAVTLGGGTDTISNTGGALTWTRRAFSIFYSTVVNISTAPAVSSVARTVTAQTTTVGGNAALKLLVVTGVDLAAPIGATGSGHATTPNLTVNAYTSTVDGSRGFGLASDDLAAATPTSSDTGFPFAVSDFSGVGAYKAANTTPAGSSVTFNFDGGVAARNWDWAAIELLPLIIPFTARRGIVLGQAVQRAAFY